jgi:hypothetical protein
VKLIDLPAGIQGQELDAGIREQVREPLFFGI